jgi:hypothetical protein
MGAKSKRLRFLLLNLWFRFLLIFWFKAHYISLQEIAINLYAEADNAVAEGNYNDASLLQSQADKLYETAENLGIVISEQEE